MNKLRHEKNEFLSNSGHHPREGDSKPTLDTLRQDSRQSGSGSDKESPVKLESGFKLETQVSVKEEPAAGDADVKIAAIVKSEESPAVPTSVTVDHREKAFNDLKAQQRELKGKHESLKSMYESSQNKIKDLKKQIANLTAAGGAANPINLASNTPASGNSVPGTQGAERRPPDDAQINKLKDKIRQLEKQLAGQKSAHQQQEEALLNEMEMTGSAFENMQDMNLRLVQQLREKDDANFKLMSGTYQKSTNPEDC